MLQLLKGIFGVSPNVDYKQLLQDGAQIIDVRTKEEYQQGHIKGSINIPLNNLSNHILKLERNRPFITCCASGMRSASAKSLLNSNGFEKVHNGGGWISLQNKI